MMDSACWAIGGYVLNSRHRVGLHVSSSTSIATFHTEWDGPSWAVRKTEVVLYYIVRHDALLVVTRLDFVMGIANDKSRAVLGLAKLERLALRSNRKTIVVHERTQGFF
jgi:hypothetical protein